MYRVILFAAVAIAALGLAAGASGDRVYTRPAFRSCRWEVRPAGAR